MSAEGEGYRMGALAKFLNDLASDADLEEAFDRKPRDVMLERGLTVEQALLILGGTLEEIRSALKEDLQLQADVDVYMIKMKA